MVHPLRNGRRGDCQLPHSLRLQARGLSLGKAWAFGHASATRQMFGWSFAADTVPIPIELAYAVLEGTVELSPVALATDDDTVAELVDVFRAIRGEDHPDWHDFLLAMVAERRLVVGLRVETAYGLTGPTTPYPPSQTAALPLVPVRGSQPSAPSPGPPLRGSPRPECGVAAMDGCNEAR